MESVAGREVVKGETTPAGITRREFLLDVLVACGLVVSSGSVITAVLKYLYPPARQIGAAAAKVMVATEDEVPDGKAKLFVWNQTPHYLIHVDDEFRAFSAKCTHLGCIVKWRDDSRVFACPCHAGFFDSNGQVISGPPPRPLPSLKVEVSSGQVFVGEA